MPMAHCDVCCLRVSTNKDKTLPKHYGDSTYGVLSHHGQKPCTASGTTRYTLESQRRHRCVRPRSGHTCPECGHGRLTLNKNGMYPKHRAPDGGFCSLSDGNHGR